jgi:hypothetical protein
VRRTPAARPRPHPVRCGEPTLDEYLARFARQNQGYGVARTFVAVSNAEPARLLGYYSLAVGAIYKENQRVLRTCRRRRPGVSPTFPASRQVAEARHGSQPSGKGAGEDLLLDALSRCLRVAEDVGIAAVLIEPRTSGLGPLRTIRV